MSLGGGAARRSVLGAAGWAGLSSLLAVTKITQAETGDDPNDADIGFYTDMSFHHEQALAMCQRVIGRPTGDPVQSLAAEILQNQSYERGLMHAWLQVWEQSTAMPTTVMGWMGMEMGAEMMPGLATPTQMSELSAASDTEQGALFLELMRAHHVGGIEMAEMAIELAATEQVTGRAAQMARSQTYEIELMDQLLGSTYA